MMLIRVEESDCLVVVVIILIHVIFADEVALGSAIVIRPLQRLLPNANVVLLSFVVVRFILLPRRRLPSGDVDGFVEGIRDPREGTGFPDAFCSQPPRQILA